MRTIVAVPILFTALSATSGSAAEPRWCAIWNDGFQSCAYTSLERCQGATAGSGGKCVEASAANAPATKTTGAATEPARVKSKNKADTVADDKLDKLIDRLNKKSDSLILCKGC